MKGTKLVIVVCLLTIISAVGGLYIFSWGTLDSWSEADKTGLRWLLGIVLGAIATLYVYISFKHKERDKIILSNWKLPDFSFKKPFITWNKKGITLGQASRYAVLFFIGVLIFGLSGGHFSAAMHYIATPLGAMATYLIVVRSQEKGIVRTAYIIWFMIATFIWLFGLVGKWFGLDLFTVFDGENAFVAPAIVWVFNELKNFEE